MKYQEYHCEQCNKPMNIVDYLVGSVCQECCEQNQRAVTHPSEQRRYKIVRFYKSNRKPKTVKIVSNLRIAQLHCNDPRTRKEGVYFDGYTKI